MPVITPRTLSGFMELLPAPQQQMERFLQTLRETYSLYGFTPLDTPLVESAEILLAKGGGETEKQIYRFSKGDADLALRFDLTVPLAKYVALHAGELAFPFRRYQIGKVYRGERAQRGRFREFYQADIDIIGDGKLDIANEAEIPAVIYTTSSAWAWSASRSGSTTARFLTASMPCRASPSAPATSCAPWTSWTRSARKRSGICWWRTYSSAASRRMRF